MQELASAAVDGFCRPSSCTGSDSRLSFQQSTGRINHQNTSSTLSDTDPVTDSEIVTSYPTFEISLTKYRDKYKFKESRIDSLREKSRSTPSDPGSVNSNDFVTSDLKQKQPEKILTENSELSLSPSACKEQSDNMNRTPHPVLSSARHIKSDSSEIPVQIITRMGK